MTYDASGNMVAVNMNDVSRDERIRIFFTARFKRLPENDLVYFNEWAERIKTGKALYYADDETEVMLRRWNLV